MAIWKRKANYFHTWLKQVVIFLKDDEQMTMIKMVTILCPWALTHKANANSIQGKIDHSVASQKNYWRI